MRKITLRSFTVIHIIEIISSLEKAFTKQARKQAARLEEEMKQFSLFLTK